MEVPQTIEIPKRRKAVSAAIHRLSAAIDDLSMTVDQIGEELQDVLAPETPPTEAINEEREDTGIALAELVDRAIDRINIINNRIQYIKERLEI